MDPAAKSTPAMQIAAALDWWREAGVDHAFHDEPAQWIAEPAAPAEQVSRKPVSARTAPPPAVAEPTQVDTSNWPRSLDNFTDWWLDTPWLDDGRNGGRVPPRGAASAWLMVLVPQPEPDDGQRLLSGSQGKLLDAIRTAMGLSEAEVYVASALPRHITMPDWAERKHKGFGTLLAHHVSLVAPKRIIAFGAGVLSLLGHDPTNSAAETLNFEHEGAIIPLFGARSLEGLLARPGWKADLWRKWLGWNARVTGPPQEQSGAQV